MSGAPCADSGHRVEIAEQLRSRIHDEQGITCSVGIASLSVAKLASRRAKPDGVSTIEPEAVADYLHPLDVVSCTASARAPARRSSGSACAPWATWPGCRSRRSSIIWDPAPVPI